MALNGGRRRTPTIDLGLGGPALVEPDNDTLTGALVEIEMLTQEDAHERLGVQNVGDFERVLRTAAGAAIAAGRIGRASRRAMAIPGRRCVDGALRPDRLVPALSVRASVTSIDGPGDRPDEAHRQTWLAPRPAPPAPVALSPVEPAR